MSEQGEVRDLLESLASGRPASTERLAELVYPELRRLASRFVRRERRGHTLQTTALAHEAYLRLVGDGEPSWEGRAHFLATAATVMRRLLIDHARARKADKRGGGEVQHLTPLEEVAGESEPLEVEALHEGLEQLAQIAERPARVLELKYFGGLTAKESACVLGVSSRTVESDLAMGLAWLARALRPDGGSE